jgi:hypothetical protein
VARQDFVTYCEGADGTHIAGHEHAGAGVAANGTCPFFVSDWPALAAHPTLASHVDTPYCLLDVTPLQHTAALRRALCGGMLRLVRGRLTRPCVCLARVRAGLRHET